MQSVRKGLRAGDITKDMYGRLKCAECELGLKKRDDPDEMGVLRYCPDCGRQWERVG